MFKSAMSPLRLSLRVVQPSRPSAPPGKPCAPPWPLAAHVHALVASSARLRLTHHTLQATQLERLRHGCHSGACSRAGPAPLSQACRWCHNGLGCSMSAIQRLLCTLKLLNRCQARRRARGAAPASRGAPPRGGRQVHRHLQAGRRPAAGPAGRAAVRPDGPPAAGRAPAPQPDTVQVLSCAVPTHSCVAGKGCSADPASSVPAGMSLQLCESAWDPATKPWPGRAEPDSSFARPLSEAARAAADAPWDRVLPTSVSDGLVECITPSTSIAAVLAEHRSILRYLELHNPLPGGEDPWLGFMSHGAQTCLHAVRVGVQM